MGETRSLTEFICDPECAINALQEANKKTGTPHVLKYKVYSRTRFYYVEPWESSEGES